MPDIFFTTIEIYRMRHILNPHEATLCVCKTDSQWAKESNLFCVFLLKGNPNVTLSLFRQGWVTVRRALSWRSHARCPRDDWWHTHLYAEVTNARSDDTVGDQRKSKGQTKPETEPDARNRTAVGHFLSLSPRQSLCAAWVTALHRGCALDGSSLRHRGARTQIYHCPGLFDLHPGVCTQSSDSTIMIFAKPSHISHGLM